MQRNKVGDHFSVLRHLHASCRHGSVVTRYFSSIIMLEFELILNSIKHWFPWDAVPYKSYTQSITVYRRFAWHSFAVKILNDLSRLFIPTLQLCVVMSHLSVCQMCFTSSGLCNLDNRDRVRDCNDIYPKSPREAVCQSWPCSRVLCNFVFEVDMKIVLYSWKSTDIDVYADSNPTGFEHTEDFGFLIKQLDSANYQITIDLPLFVVHSCFQ